MCVLFHPIRMILPNMFQQQTRCTEYQDSLMIKGNRLVDLMNPQQGWGARWSYNQRSQKFSQAHDSQITAMDKNNV